MRSRGDGEEGTLQKNILKKVKAGCVNRLNQLWQIKVREGSKMTMVFSLRFQKNDSPLLQHYRVDGLAYSASHPF